MKRMKILTYKRIEISNYGTMININAFKNKHYMRDRQGIRPSQVN